MQKPGSVYILSSPDKTALYTGVTSELYNRVWKHKNKHYPDSFSARYNCNLLVYYAHYDSIEEAILAEKKIKAGRRQKKLDLVNGFNPEWKDLWDDVF